MVKVGGDMNIRKYIKLINDIKIDVLYEIADKLMGHPILLIVVSSFLGATIGHLVWFQAIRPWLCSLITSC